MKTHKKTLIVLDFLEYGGACRMMQDFEVALHSHEVHVLAGKLTEHANDDTSFLDAMLHIFPVRFALSPLRTYGGIFLSTWWALWRRELGEFFQETSRTHKTIILNSPASSLAVLLHPKCFGIKKIVFFHGLFNKELRSLRPVNGGGLGKLRARCVDSLFFMLQAAVNRFATKVLCFSEYALRLAISSYFAPEKRTFLVRPPLSESLFKIQELSSSMRVSLRATYVSNEELLVFLPSRIEPRKGILEALQALALLKEQGCHTRIVFLLSGPTTESWYLDQIFQVCRHFQLFDRVRFIPPCSRQEVFQLYQVVDLVLLPSLDLETLGLVTLEAMRYGTPVMAFSRGASSEILGEDLQETLLVPEVSAQSLASSLLAFTRLDEDGLARLQRRVEKRYQEFKTSDPETIELIDAS